MVPTVLGILLRNGPSNEQAHAHPGHAALARQCEGAPWPYSPKHDDARRSPQSFRGAGPRGHIHRTPPNATAASRGVGKGLQRALALRSAQQLGDPTVRLTERPHDLVLPTQKVRPYAVPAVTPWRKPR